MVTTAQPSHIIAHGDVCISFRNREIVPIHPMVKMRNIVTMLFVEFM